MTAFSREEIHAAWKRRMELQDADDWDGFGNTFTDDAVYHEHHYGIFRGRKAILEWLVPVIGYPTPRERPGCGFEAACRRGVRPRCDRIG